MRKILGAIAPVVAVASLFGQSAQRAVVMSLSVTDQITLHEPVVFRYIVTNDSDQDAWTNAGSDRIAAFDFEVVNPGGGRQVGRRVPKEGGSRTDPFAIPKGESYSQSKAIGEWLEFSEVGRYSITVTFLGTIGHGAVPSRTALFGPGRVSFPGSVPTFPEFRPSASEAEGRQTRMFLLDVLPRDEARLRAVCEALFVRANRTGMRDTGDAQDELGSIRDVVVVPYLEALLKAERTSRYFEVLANMGTPEARAALQRLANGPEGWVAQDAKRFLLTAK